MFDSSGDFWGRTGVNSLREFVVTTFPSYEQPGLAYQEFRLPVELLSGFLSQVVPTLRTDLTGPELDRLRIDHWCLRTP